MNREDTYDEETGDVTRSVYTATFEKSKTNAKLQGQKRTILITEAGKEPQWFGLPELYDGTLWYTHGGFGRIKNGISVSITTA